MKSRTLTIQIARGAEAVYEFVSDLRNLPLWATAFCRSIQPSGGAWTAETPQGPVTIRIAPRNEFGVLDHSVIAAGGAEVVVPMRVVAAGDGAEVLFTLLQGPGMPDEQFAKDAKLVEQDLSTLKRVLERAGGHETRSRPPTA
ncbi:MAG TPA: SRPBCC family protein [bacterium]